jgi:hypothetical protein
VKAHSNPPLHVPSHPIWKLAMILFLFFFLNEKPRRKKKDDEEEEKEKRYEPWLHAEHFAGLKICSFFFFPIF